jgi:hypothetical protein
MDDDVVMWVLKLNNGLYMVSKPGQTPKKVTRDEFIGNLVVCFEIVDLALCCC